MEVLPSDYRQLELSRNEKIFIQNVNSEEQFGYLVINANPALQRNTRMHILVCAEGILFFRFFDEIQDAESFEKAMQVFSTSIYKQTADILSEKLCSNKAIVGTDEKLMFPTNILYCFPAISREEINAVKDSDLQSFACGHCLFKDDLVRFRTDFSSLLTECLGEPILECSVSQIEISEKNINSVMQRLVPEYFTLRSSCVTDTETKTGADNELLIVTPNDRAARAFQLDEEQINIINKIQKGEQLLLACPGSGKSVLLISKCFKAAEMNPDKEFLITCYNNKLYSLFTWLIDMAGLKAKNVTCLTFHSLCRKLLKDNGFHVKPGDFDGWTKSVIARFHNNKIHERYYGIFIDEVQQFDTTWYKFCFDLLENKESNDHLFVICGDKTQELSNLQRHGRAPWNAGEGYPNFRGKTLRLEKNYRNSIEINDFVNRFVSNAREYLHSIDYDAEIDPDMFLRGKCLFSGPEVKIQYLRDKSNCGEAKMVLKSIKAIHDEQQIPYDEIAVIMYYGAYSGWRFDGWNDRKYNIQDELEKQLEINDITFYKLYGEQDHGYYWILANGGEGVRLIKLDASLGLDFQAVILCGLLPVGVYDRTKNLNWEGIKEDDKFQERMDSLNKNIRALYVACTRAREVLHIILPETGENSVYVKMIEGAEK